MAEFKEILRFERVDESGNVLQAEDIDLRRGIVGEADPTENTPGMAGLPYYVVRDGKITAEYVCVAAEEGVYTWKKKESGAVDDTLTVPGAAADAKAVGDKVAELSGAIAEKVGTAELKTAVETALTEAKESGEFKGEKGDPGQPGAPGADYVLTEEDKTKIAQEAAALVDTALLSIIGSGVTA